jgi:hypothetical protein
MIQIKELFFPSLCHRCLKKERNFLCSTCLLGIELGAIKRGDTASLFDVGADFLLTKRKAYQEIIISCATVQLQKLNWRYGSIESEPELIYLKKYLDKATLSEAEKPLYLVSREVNPILLEPMKKDRFVLLI